jgi:integrase
VFPRLSYNMKKTFDIAALRRIMSCRRSPVVSFCVFPWCFPRRKATLETSMAGNRICKRVVDSIRPNGTEFTVWDDALTGFGVRVRPSGARSYIVVYRAGVGRKAPVRKVTIGSVGKITPHVARDLAQKALGSVAHGKDPAAERAHDRQGLTVKELVEAFLEEHSDLKLKPSTSTRYRHLLRHWVVPELGSTKADSLSRAAVAKLHAKMKKKAVSANRMLGAISSMYGFAQRRGMVPEGFSPASRIEKYDERRRERFLTTQELARIGEALREAETKGIPWIVDELQPNAKHIPKKDTSRRTIFSSFATAAVRLLLFSGCRLREILHLKWEHVDFERGLLLLPDSKTGNRTVVLNAPALAVLNSLSRLGSYAVPGEDPEQPRHDLKRVWQAVSRRAGLSRVRIHDLRHTYASFGAGGGMGLPIIGKLLGHSQAATTERYAHLESDPLRRASEAIAGRIAAALGEKRKSSADVVPLTRKR